MGKFSNNYRTNKLKVVAFVVARLSSSRFPAKHLSMIGNQRLIDWTIAGLKQSDEIDQIVIATVAESENEPLRQVALNQQVEFFWYEGEVDHVTTRLRKAAEEYDADICLLISGDCPLVDGQLVDHLVRELKNSPSADYVKVMPGSNGDAPMSEGVGVYRKSTWQRGDDLSDRPELKEHQFPIISRSPEIFTPVLSVLPPQYYGIKHRLSVDTRADLEFMNKVFDELGKCQRSFSLPEVVGLLANDESLRQINAHVHQRCLVEHIRKALFVVDATEDAGRETLRRCIELGHQMVERISSPVCFMVDDLRAMKEVNAAALSIRWGALGREVNLPPGEIPSHNEVSGEFELVILDTKSASRLEDNWYQALHQNCTVIILDTVEFPLNKPDLIADPSVLNLTLSDDLPSMVQAIQDTFRPEK